MLTWGESLKQVHHNDKGVSSNFLMSAIGCLSIF